MGTAADSAFTHAVSLSLPNCRQMLHFEQRTTLKSRPAATALPKCYTFVSYVETASTTLRLDLSWSTTALSSSGRAPLPRFPLAPKAPHIPSLSVSVPWIIAVIFFCSRQPPVAPTTQRVLVPRPQSRLPGRAEEARRLAGKHAVRNDSMHDVSRTSSQHEEPFLPSDAR